MPLTRVVYIEATDFREDKPKGYYGFCPQQPIMLKCACQPLSYHICWSTWLELGLGMVQPFSTHSSFLPCAHPRPSCLGSCRSV